MSAAHHPLTKPVCETCGALRRELAGALREAAEWRERAAEMLEALAEWNRAAAAALDSRRDAGA